MVTRDGKNRVRVANNTLSASSSPNETILPPDITVRDFNLSADEEHVVVLAEPSSLPIEKIMLIYDRNTMQLLSKRQFEFGKANQCARVGSDELHALIVNQDFYPIVDFAKGSVVFEFPFRAGVVIGAEFSPAGDRIAVFGSDGTVTLVHATNGMILDWINSGRIMEMNQRHSVLIVRAKNCLSQGLTKISVGPYFPISRVLLTRLGQAFRLVWPGDRAKYYLPLEPPNWCVRLEKSLTILMSGSAGLTHEKREWMHSCRHLASVTTK